MTITFDLSDVESKHLADMADRLGIAPADLAKATVTDVLGNAGEDFAVAAKYVLEKNHELYRRLS